MRGRILPVAGWCAVGAGVLGLLGLASTIPWPELYSFDARPQNAVTRDPGLLPVLVAHYAILATGGLLGLTAGVLVAMVLRHRPLAAVSTLLVAAGAGMMGYAAGRRAIDVAVNDGRSTLELETLVWVGGSLLLLGTLVLTLVLRRQAGKVFLVLGIASPVLVAGGTAAFLLLGETAIPMVWGVTFPPPPDYLLAMWFIALGWLARTGRLPTRGSPSTSRGLGEEARTALHGHDR